METKVQNTKVKTQTKFNQITGSEAIIQCLMLEGVDTVFGYPGGTIMPVYDAMYDFQKQFKHILVRHEQGAVHAAQGYARVSGKTGVSIVTSGPGATNTITGIADAMIDSTPMVVISGQVAAPLLGTDAFQETDVVGISQPITKWSCQVTKPEEIPVAIAKAFYIASTGRPGPVVIDITKNAQFGKLDFEYKKCRGIRSYIPYPKLKIDQVKEAAKLINNAKKPYALVGQGVILGKAETELKKLLEKAGIPAAWTLLGLSAMPSDYKYNVGMLGMHGNYAPNIKTNECDLLISIGMRFDDRVTGNLKSYATQAKIIHFDIDPSEINKNVKVDVPVVANVKESLAAILEFVEENQHNEWLQEFRKCDEIEEEKVLNDELYPTKEGMTMGEVVRRVSEFTNHEAIVVTDVGQHQMMASRYFKFKKPKSFVSSGGLGTMGFGLPAALGAKLGAPERDVCLFVGDGGLQMTIQELGTIFQSNAAVKIIVLNNNFLGMVRQWQELFFNKRYSHTELCNPDFITIAKGFGVPGHVVDKRENLDKSISAMMEHNGPYLLEVKVEKEGNVFPMVPAGASVSDVILSKDQIKI